MTVETEILNIKTRLRNLEEVVKKLLTLYSNFSSNKEVQELTTVLSKEISDLRADLESAVSRIEILEDVPDIDF